MKKILGIAILGFVFISLYQSPTLASEYMSDEDCAVLSGKAYTDYAARERAGRDTCCIVVDN